MKIIKTLTVDHKPYGLVTDDVRIELCSPGRSIFVVLSDHTLSGIVALKIGWSDSETYSWFIGYIENSVTIDQQQQKLFCRELTATLNRPISLGLRHVSVKDVLTELSELTSINYATPKANYIYQQSPYFYHIGGGYQAMDAIGRVYGIKQYIWQQQGDGSVYVGSWQDSRWADKPVQIPDNLFTQHMSTNSASLPMTPALRPGVRFNRGIVDAVQLSAESMVISWKPSSDW